MYYPKSCFSANETATQAARREYDVKVKHWYKIALSVYPDYFKMNFRDRIKAREAINKQAGFSI